MNLIASSVYIPAGNKTGFIFCGSITDNMQLMFSVQNVMKNVPFL